MIYTCINYPISALVHTFAYIDSSIFELTANSYDIIIIAVVKKKKKYFVRQDMHLGNSSDFSEIEA